MKRIMVTVFAIGMAGCLAMEPEPTGAGDPAAATGASEAESQQAATQDCVFIDWCDQPNSTNGTVCIVRSTSACQSQCSPSILPAIVSECNADAKAVCGTIVSPARIFCSRSQE